MKKRKMVKALTRLAEQCSDAQYVAHDAQAALTDGSSVDDQLKRLIFLTLRLEELQEDIEDLAWGIDPDGELVFERGPVTVEERELLDDLKADYEQVFAAPSSIAFKADEVNR